MKQIYNFTNNCPTLSQYKLYLSKEGDVDFHKAFVNHLGECSLCNEAMEGYQLANITHFEPLLEKPSKFIKKKTQKVPVLSLQVLAYAASIAILIGVSISIFIHNHSKLSDQFSEDFDYSLLMNQPSVGNKTLSKKSADQFIYIGDCNYIAYNDQFISAEELSNNLSKLPNIGSVCIEVGENSQQCVNELINTIKSKSAHSVITITNSSDKKKLTSKVGV